MSGAAFTVLVVDDERPARDKLARLLADDPRFRLAGEAADGLAALAAIDALAPDLLVLDVQMPGMDGFETLAALGPDPALAVVFSTAHDAHALRAFDAHAVDYLLKPYDRARLRRALDKAWAQLVAGKSTPGLAGAVEDAVAARPCRRLPLRAGTGWITLDPAVITRITAADKHVHVFAGGPPLVVRQSLSTMLARLDEGRFLRVHRSEVVNLDAVVGVEPWTHGDAIVVLRDGSSVILSRTHRHAFLARFAAPRR